MKRKILWLGLSFLLVAALVLASCGPAVEEEEETQYGGTLTAYLWGDDAPSADMTEGLWPTIMYTGPVIQFLMMGDFEKYGPRGTNEYPFAGVTTTPEEFLKGALAESWTVSADEIVFNIRQGVYWTGQSVNPGVMEARELTADDVVDSLNRFLTNMPWVNADEWIKSITATDPYTVVVETTGFKNDWVSLVAKGWCNGIYAPEVVEAGASDWNNLVGTGPFMIKEYVAGSYMAYERNPNYWDTATIDGEEYDIPFVDELIYPSIPDESMRIAALRTAEIDIMMEASLKYEDTLAQTSPELVTNEWIHSHMAYISLRVDTEPLSNKEVRRALMIALDREAILEAVYTKGTVYGWPVSTAIGSVYTPIDELPAATQELFVEYDPVSSPATAMQMLADEGYTEGDIELEILIRSGGGVGGWGDEEIGTMAAAYWADIGVEVDLEILESVAFWATLDAGEHKHAVVENENTATPVASLKSGFIPGETSNFALYDNPDYTALYNEAAQTVDADERAAMFKELAVIALDDVAYIPVCAPALLTYWWPWVKNYYGERDDDMTMASHFIAAIWIDQDLKAEMGF